MIKLITIAIITSPFLFCIGTIAYGLGKDLLDSVVGEVESAYDYLKLN